jgi:hypothetical protein
MQRATGNHWISHVVIIVILFAVFGWGFARLNSGAKMPVSRLTGIVCAGVAAGVLLVLGFYVIAD